MRISIVIPSFYPAVIYGGTIFASLNNAKTIAGNGNEVYVSTTNTNMYSRLEVPTGRFLPQEKNIWVKYYNETVIDKLSLPLIFQVWKDIRQADIVHIQAVFNTPIPFALLYARLFNKPVLLSPHGVLGNWVMGQGLRFKKLWLSLFIRPFSHNIVWHATSELEKKEILNHFPKARIVVIPNALDLKEFETIHALSRLEFLKKYGKGETAPEKIVISMGRLHKKKGFDILIEAFEGVTQTHPGMMLFIAGEDEGEKQNLEALITAKGLAGKVFLVGSLNGQEKIDFLANADLFVLPSRSENFGMVYAEALAAGTPIIASRETPWEEVEEAGCGKWVPNTPEDTEAAIMELLRKDPSDMRIKSKQFIQKFSFTSVARAFETIFNKMREQNA